MTANPTYQNLGDYTETIQIEFDPWQISYGELLAVFWESHNPGIEAWSVQYMSIIFYHDEDQQKLAKASMQEIEQKSGRRIFTEIRPFSEFYLAEDYHQKYYLRREALIFKELTNIYPESSSLIDSTAAAKINGYIGGYGNSKTMREQLDSLGLSPAGNSRLLEIGRRLPQD